jgi:RES domain
MIDAAPEPPGDLSTRELPIVAIPALSNLFRIHKSANNAKYFGRSASWRFDDPRSTYGTLYAGMLPRVAFAETLLRGQGSLVAVAELALRSLCRFTAARAINLVPLHGRHLIAMGATASVSSGPYAVAQRWSRALHDHPDRPDGIVYRATHDNDELAVVMFERAFEAIDVGESQQLLADSALLGGMLNHYRAALR